MVKVPPSAKSLAFPYLFKIQLESPRKNRVFLQIDLAILRLDVPPRILLRDGARVANVARILNRDT